MNKFFLTNRKYEKKKAQDKFVGIQSVKRDCDVLKQIGKSTGIVCIVSSLVLLIVDLVFEDYYFAQFDCIILLFACIFFKFWQDEQEF